MCEMLLRAVVLNLGLLSVGTTGGLTTGGRPPRGEAPNGISSKVLGGTMLPVQGPHLEKTALECRQHSCLLSSDVSLAATERPARRRC